MLSSLLTMAVFALTGAITPGPVNVLALRHGTQSRRATTVLYVLGASLSYTGIVWLMGQSGHWLQTWPPLMQWAPCICAAYLLWMAWQLFHAPVTRPTARAPAPSHVQRSVFTAFIQGLAVQSLNPKAWLVALSGIGMFVIPISSQHLSIEQALLWFCAISLLACLIGVGCWAALGQWLNQWLCTPRRQQRLNQTLALLLVLSVVAMLA